MNVPKEIVNRFIRYEITFWHMVLWMLIWTLNQQGIERINRRVLAETLGWHRSTTQRNLKGLERRGLIQRTHGRIRAIL